MSQLPWNEAQWARVQSAVTEEFTKSSVSGAALPCFGPLEASTEAISLQNLRMANGPSGKLTLAVEDFQTTRFWNATIFVELNGQQVKDEDLASALFAFRRAANCLARVEDHVVFNGMSTDPGRKIKFLGQPAGHDDARLPAALSTVKLTSDHAARGLLTLVFASEAGATSVEFQTVGNDVNGDPSVISVEADSVEGASSPRSARKYGENLVEGISAAISTLEKRGYAGPFACIMSPKAYNEAHRPSAGSLVMPSDRIAPMLGGPLLRSGAMEDGYAVVVAHSTDSVDIVVATAPRVHFLQIRDDGRYLFRVYERFALRIKDPAAVMPLLLR